MSTEEESRIGRCVWFTGLSGAGKSTLARALVTALSSKGRDAVLLDGDEVRASSPVALGFSRHDRDTHVMRVASLALPIVERNGIAVCALISPYRDTRARARELIGARRFIEVFVDTPLQVCEQRDPKGLYARARRGDIGNFTGISDPYEPPPEPDVRLVATDSAVDRHIGQLLELLGTSAGP